MVPHDLQHVSDEVRDFYTRAHRVLDAIMRQEGLSFARTKHLSYIRRVGPVRSADIVCTFGLSPRTVTEAVDTLERDGLVAREADPDDRRAKRIRITPAGEAALAAAEPAHGRFLEAVFGPMEEQERAIFSATLHRLNERLAALEAER